MLNSFKVVKYAFFLIVKVFFIDLFFIIKLILQNSLFGYLNLATWLCKKIAKYIIIAAFLMNYIIKLTIFISELLEYFLIFN